MRRITRAVPRVITVAVAALVTAVLVTAGAPAPQAWPTDAPGAMPPGTAGQTPTSLTTQPPDPAPEEDGEPLQAPGGRQVVLIGLPGLAWEDITTATPNLMSLSEQTGASLIVRSIRSSACPADGWLAVSTGNRAGDLPGPCRTLTEPGDDGQVPGWSDYQESADGLNYRAELGTFGQALTDQGISAVGIGPGAAIALADREGFPTDHHPREHTEEELAAQVLAVAGETDLLAIDAGALRPVPRPHREEHTDEDAPLISPVDPEVHRAEQLELADRRVGAILTGLQEAGTDPVVVLAGLADDSSAGLRVLAVTGAEGEVGLGTSAATRQTGYVMTTDLLPTLLSMLGGEPVPHSGVIGAHMRVEATEMDAAERRDHLIARDVHAQSVRPVTPTYYLIMVIVNLVLFGALAVGLKRPAAERVRTFLQHRAPAVAKRLTAFTVNRGKVLRGMRVAALSIAALPVSSFLANLLPWWRTHPPALGLAGAIVLFVALIVTLALTGPWRRHVLGAPTVVAGITAVVLIGDIATGARLQLDAVMGTSTLVAGRMYGMNNTAFTLFTVSMLMVTIAIANHLVLRGRRTLAGLVTAVIGIAAAVFDGAPGLGADFGGPPAILPAFALLALIAAGIRLTVLRIALVLIGAALATLGFAFVDWLRPPEDRTHLGAFFQTILDGGMWQVIWRNLQANLGILFGNTPLTLLALAGVLTVIFVFARPIRSALRDPGMPDSIARGTPLSEMGRAAPMLPPGITAIAVGLGIGMAVNDSGVAIVAVGVAVGVPLLVAASCTWMLGLSLDNGRTGAAVPTSATGAAVPTSAGDQAAVAGGAEKPEGRESPVKGESPAKPESPAEPELPTKADDDARR